jgi:hypothetical protein
MAAGYASGEYDAETQEFIVSEGDLHSWPEVYFPGYGWVEFEPTVSQPPLERTSGESFDEGAAAAGGDEAAAGDEGETAGGIPFDPLGQLEDVQDIEIPEIPVPPTPWLFYLLIVLVLVAAIIYLTPARRIVAGWAVIGARRAGKSAPPIVEEWASQPASEAAAVFRRLAPWPNRLGIHLDSDSTPAERGQAIAGVVPEVHGPVMRIADAYAAERYGGLSPAKGDMSRAWRSIRLHLYRGALAHLADIILQNEPD